MRPPGRLLCTTRLMCAHLQIVVWHLNRIWYVCQGTTWARTFTCTNATTIYDMNTPLGPNFIQLYSLAWCCDARGLSFRKFKAMCHSSWEFGFLVMAGVPGK